MKGVESRDASIGIIALRPRDFSSYMTATSSLTSATR